MYYRSTKSTLYSFTVWSAGVAADPEGHLCSRMPTAPSGGGERQDNGG